MIPGIVAASGAGGGGGSPFPGALAVADFVNRTYFIGDNAVSAADIIDKPGNVVPGSGLSIDWDIPGDVVTPIGDFLAAMCLAEFTIVVEIFSHADTAGSTINVVNARLASDPSDFYWLMSSFNTGAFFDSDNRNGISGQRFISPNATAVPPSTRRIAATRTFDRISGSTNGGTVETDTSGGWTTVDAMDTAILGAQVGDTDPNFKGYIRSIVIYDPVSDAQLPTLST